METVAFYSYKGGVGRTLLVANTAQFLAMSGRKVVALDLDLEAPGLHQKLGSREVTSRAAEGTLRGAVDELLDILEKPPSERSPAIAFEEVNLPTGTNGSLRLIPAGAAPSHKYWSALERLNWVLRTRSREGGLPEAVMELRARIRKELKPDFLLIDSRTGITELGGLATSLLADRVVCLTTTAPESVEGTKVVADALRKAPRLKSQKPLGLEALLSRVVNENSPNIFKVRKDFDQLGISVHILPHDREIADEERILFRSGGSQTTQENSGRNEDGDQRLFSATLHWIERSFRGGQEDSESARQKLQIEKARERMKEIDSAWKELTATSAQVGRWYTGRDAWPTERLRRGVAFTRGRQARYADIVAYNSSFENARPQMIVEYIDDEDRDAVAKWWLEKTDAKIVVMIGKGNLPPISVISRGCRSDRWWNTLPLPKDFDILADPADDSLDSILNTVRRGHDDYLDRIVKAWVHSSAAGLHGGMPWKPQVARSIVDSLARVDDIQLATRILAETSRGPMSRNEWIGSADDWLDQQVRAELFAPLLWRLFLRRHQLK